MNDACVNSFRNFPLLTCRILVAMLTVCERIGDLFIGWYVFKMDASILLPHPSSSHANTPTSN